MKYYKATSNKTFFVSYMNIFPFWIDYAKF